MAGRWTGTARTYVDPSNPESAEVAPWDGTIEMLLGAPFVQQGLKLDYTTYVLKDAEVGRQRVVLSLTTDLPLRAKAGEAADVVFVVRDVRDGRVVASGLESGIAIVRTHHPALGDASDERIRLSRIASQRSRSGSSDGSDRRSERFTSSVSTSMSGWRSRTWKTWSAATATR